MNKIENDAADQSPKSNKDDQLRIAWRYGQQQASPPNNKPLNDLAAKSYQPNYFVMNKLMNKEDVFNNSNVKFFDLNDACMNQQESSSTTSSKNMYLNLAKSISEHIESLNLNINKTKQYTNILRIGG